MTLNSKQKHILSQILILLLTNIVRCDAKFLYSTILDIASGLNLEWNVNYRESFVEFQLTGSLKDKEWLLFGFSDYGDYINADLIVYWPIARHKSLFKDANTDLHGNLRIDRNQNYVLISDIRRQGGFFRIDFTRKFNTCDVHDYRFDNGTTHIIFFRSFGRLGNLNLRTLKGGLQRVQLLKPEVAHLQVPDDVITIDVTNPKITIPSKDTTYWWYVNKLPELTQKHHIIKYQGIIQKGNEHLVHHMEVFHCQVDKDKTIPHYNGPGLAEGKPPGLSVCRKVIGAWAMGASAVTLPEEAGTPIGGLERSRYVLLEVHYNNPQLKKGIVDSSGIRLYVTNKLRKYDSGIMEIGLEYTNKMAIPPHQDIFKLTGYCVPGCTETGLPKHGIHVYASQLHTHLTGKRVFTKHVRNGKELLELNRDNHYSPHFQEIRSLSQPIEILPGDSLITTCEDSTADRSNVTLGGFSIQQEMCVNYIHYYPATSLEVCKSSVDTDALQRFFKFINKYYDDPTQDDKTIEENYYSIRWTRDKVHLLKTFYNVAALSVECKQSNGAMFPGNWNNIQIPRITQPLQKPMDNCL